MTAYCNKPREIGIKYNQRQSETYIVTNVTIVTFVTIYNYSIVNAYMKHSEQELYGNLEFKKYNLGYVVEHASPSGLVAT